MTAVQLGGVSVSSGNLDAHCPYCPCLFVSRGWKASRGHSTSLLTPHLVLPGLLRRGELLLPRQRSAGLRPGGSEGEGGGGGAPRWVSPLPHNAFLVGPCCSCLVRPPGSRPGQSRPRSLLANTISHWGCSMLPLLHAPPIQHVPCGPLRHLSASTMLPLLHACAMCPPPPA